MAASETKVIELETKLNEMMKKLERIEEGTSRMAKFIEGVYGTVSAPMFWVCNKVNRLRGEIKEATPPTLENENEKTKEMNILEQD